MIEANPEYHTSRIHPALTSFVDECRATLVRLIAYVGALALLASLAVVAWDHLKWHEADEPATQTGFVLAPSSSPTFALSSPDPRERSNTYEAFRHPEGGRKDVFRWGAPAELGSAELEIYRFGAEFDASQAVTDDIARRMAPSAPPSLETAGMIDSKFGAITLLRLQGSVEGAKSCLGFFKRFGEAALQISGWSCQSANLPARRTAIGCMVNRLTLLAFGSDPKLAELFAHAETRRSTCSAVIAAPVDWVMGLENPRLRGTL